jgi:hypothetical protein
MNYKLKLLVLIKIHLVFYVILKLTIRVTGLGKGSSFSILALSFKRSNSLVAAISSLL